MSGFHQGRPPRNKGLRYPPDPPTVEEIVAVMRVVGDRPDGLRLRGVIVVLWRAGLRISEALALQESDLDRTRGAVLVRRGKGDECRFRHSPPYVHARTMLRAFIDARHGWGSRLLG
jgi:integrase